VADLHLRYVNFGPELYGRSRGGKVGAFLASFAAIPSIVGLIWFIRSQGIEILHTSDRPRDAFVCVWLARLTAAKCIIHVHVAYGDWMSPMLKWSLKRADTLIAVSEFVGRTLTSSAHPAERVHVVLNGIDPAAWHPAAGRRDARRELGIAERAPVIVTVCRLFPPKGPEELIRAMPALLEEQPALRLVIVGDEMVSGFRQELEELAASLGVTDSVTFTGRRTDVPRLMAAADIFAMPSLEEPFGLVFAEAMAMRLPVVALDSGGTREVVEDGVTGLLSEPGDLQALTTHLLALLRDPLRREQMGALGRCRVEENFTTPRVARDVAAVYRTLTTRTPTTLEVGGR